MLKSPQNTTLPKDAPIKELKFELTGNMNRYVMEFKQQSSFRNR
jgi:hypothetical protein